MQQTICRKVNLFLDILVSTPMIWEFRLSLVKILVIYDNPPITKTRSVYFKPGIKESTRLSMLVGIPEAIRLWSIFFFTLNYFIVKKLEKILVWFCRKTNGGIWKLRKFPIKLISHMSESMILINGSAWTKKKHLFLKILLLCLKKFEKNSSLVALEKRSRHLKTEEILYKMDWLYEQIGDFYQWLSMDKPKKHIY